ncbi:MAG: tetratricopeptide repeat protein [Pirellulales bacterium]|nr:tetratricopeptide repeat protein [Pirellulales bacterium]
MPRASRQHESSRSADLRRLAAIAVLFLAVATAIYGQTATFRFLGYDDPFYVVNNRHVHEGLSWSGLAWAWTSVRAFWHPLTWMSHQLDWQLYGNRPAGHHVSNVIYHLAGILAALMAWYRLTGKVWPAALIAGLLLVHPLRAESVAWVAERKGLLATLFWMLGLWAYAEYARRPSWARYALVAGCMAAGLLCKPTLVTFPCALLLLDLWPLGRWKPWTPPDLSARGPYLVADPPLAQRSLPALLLEKLPLFAIVAAASGVAVLAEQEFGALDWIPQLTLASRVENAVIVYWLYLAKFVLPAGLSFFYRHPGNAVSPVAAAVAAMALLAVTVVCVLQVRRRPFALVGWLWFLGTLLPVIGLVQIGGHRMADRYADVPMIGIYALLAYALAELVARVPAAREPVVAACVAVFGALGAVSYQQASYWHDDERLIEHALAVDPDNYVALTNRARRAMDEQRFTDAIADCRRALAIHPYNAAAASNLGLALDRVGEHDEALSWLRKAVELAPQAAINRMNLALGLAGRDQMAEAEAEFRAAVDADPDNVPVRRNFAVFFAQQRRFEEAVAMFRSILTIEPDNLLDRGNLARTMLAQGDLDGAITVTTEVLARDAKFGESYALRADALARQGKAPEAVADFGRASQLGALPPAMLMRLVWIFAADPRPEVRNPEQALALAERLARMTGQRDPAALDALAMALAATARFDDAIRTARDGADLARRAGRAPVAAILEQHLGLYTRRQPLAANYAELATAWDRAG